MLLSKKTIVLFSTLSGFLLLGACGSDEAETTSAPAPVAESSAPAVEAAPAATTGGETLTLDQIEKAEGVVYQDEIYANWPYTEQGE